MDKAQKKSNINDKLSLMALIVVIWPGVVWYMARLFDHSDEPCGLLAMFSLIALSVWRSDARNDSHTSPSGYLPALAILLIYIFAYAFAPHLSAALLLIFVTWFILVRKISPRYRASYFGLALLSLPLISSLNFYAGYPLRLCIASGACLVLNLFGLATKLDGVMLSMHGQQIAIDAPCSGVFMLWTALFVAMLCAVINSLKTRATVVVALSAFIFVVLGNVWRATTLVLFDSARPLFASILKLNAAQIEPFVHMGTGVCTFLLVCALTIFISFKLESIQKENSPVDTQEKSLGFFDAISEYCARKSFKISQAFIPVCLMAAILPVFAPRSHAVLEAPAAIKFPTEINGIKVTPVQTLGEEDAFARDFPGQMKRFTDGRNSYFVRIVLKETRQLHPSSDCFKGMGYSVEPGEIKIGYQESYWSSFDAAKNEKKYLVLERITDSTGQSWTDVSAWYWAVVAGKTDGPWTAITIARRII